MSDWPRPLHGWDHRHWSSAERTGYERELLRLLNEYFDFRPREDRPYVLSIEATAHIPRRYSQSGAATANEPPPPRSTVG